MVDSSTLNQLKSLSIDDRIEIVQVVWDSIAEENGVPPLSDELRSLLQKRLSEDEANPDDVETWDEISAALKVQR